MGVLRYHTHQGDFKSVLRAGVAVAKRLAPNLARSLPGIGTVVGIASTAATVASLTRPTVSQAQNGGAPGSRVHPTNVLPGGQPFITDQRVQFGGQKPSGYHLNKSAGKYGSAGTYYVRNRRMNPANGRAIRRASKRLNSAIKMFRKVLSITNPGKAGGKIKPKTTRKRS